MITQDFQSRMADAVSKLGGELADIGGAVEDTKGRALEQQDRSHLLAERANTMAQKLQTIASLAQASQTEATNSCALITQSEAALQKATTDIERLISNVEAVAHDISSLAQAIGEISQVAGVIGGIARQTNLLALNATIEAARAGEAGRGFSVVAGEVKALARETAQATDRIGMIVKTLQMRAGDVERRGAEGAQQAVAVSEGTGQMAELIKSFGGFATTAQRESEAVSRTVLEIVHEVDFVNEMAHSLAQDMRLSTDDLVHANGRINALTLLAQDLVGLAASSGLETIDTPFIRKAQETAKAISAAFEKAVETGQISVNDLFDREYRPVAESNPPQFTTRWTRLAEALLPSLQEPVLSFDPKIEAVVTVDSNGYLPVHVPKYNNPQRKNDPTWNIAHCRQKRIYDDPVGLKAARNTSNFLLQYYQRDLGKGQKMLLKSLSVPIFIQGRHWGALRIGYRV